MAVQPISNFATAGARAYGSLGIIPDADSDFARRFGLQPSTREQTPHTGLDLNCRRALRL